MEKLVVVGNGMAVVACPAPTQSASPTRSLLVVLAICPYGGLQIEVAALGISIPASTR